MKSLNSRHTSISVISFFAIFLLFHLPKTEIHPWDEGLYAIRALSIVEGGNLIDQTEDSPGGLYSSTYPPLTVWAMSVFIKIFGANEFSVRLFSYLCSVGSLIFLYLITLRLLNEENAIFSVILLSVSLAWNIYSRQGMTEVPVIFFCLICLWSLIKLHESDNKKTWLYVIIYGLAFGAALMTKIVVTFLPLLFAFVYILFSGKHLKSIITGTLIGLVIAFPWHYYMYLIHGQDFINAFLVPHIYSPVESNVPNLGVFYHINQIIISNPFSVFAFISVFFVIEKSNSQEKKIIKNILIIIILSWFYFTIFIFSVSVTKLPHYIIYFLVPSVILAVKVYEVLEEKQYNPRLVWFLFSFLIISTLWSIGEGLRLDFKLFLSDFRISLPVLTFIIISLTLLLTGAFISKSILEKIKFKYYARGSYIILLVLVLRIVFYSSFALSEREDGARQTVEFMDHLKQEKFIYLFHFYNTSDTLNPQLEWYFRINPSAKENIPELVKISLKSEIWDIRNIRKVDNLQNLFLIYYTPQSKELKQMVLEDLLQTRKIVFQTRKYIVLGRKKVDRSTGYWI